MAGVSETLVREYFESLDFVVCQPCKYVTIGRHPNAEAELDVIVVNPRAIEQKIPEELVWETSHLANISRAVVAVRGWHTNRFSASMFEKAPEILRFTEDAATRAAAKRLGTTDFARILCLAELPASHELKSRALTVLREKGVHGVLLFRTILQHLVGHVDSAKNYEKSDLLQVIRIFKRYGFFRDGQMELFGDKRRNRRKQ